jgi:hypothetical protein
MALAGKWPVSAPLQSRLGYGDSAPLQSRLGLRHFRSLTVWYAGFRSLTVAAWLFYRGAGEVERERVEADAGVAEQRAGGVGEIDLGDLVADDGLDLAQLAIPQ